MSVIELRNVRKSFGALEILKGINQIITGPKFVVILGPSGCGKSTLLRIIAGLESLSGGELLVDGKRVDGQPPHLRDMAMVFQNYALYPHMTVAQNLSYGLRMRGASKDEISPKVAEAARMLQIEALLGRRPSELSGGQRQRVAMGRAIVRTPKAFLFDEPLSNLDAKLRNEMRLEIRRVHDKLQGTSVLVTHDQVEAMTMADLIIVMNGGVVVQAGTPLEIYNQPADRFVASFVGNPMMNFFDGFAGQSSDTVAIAGKEYALGRRLEARPGTPICLGLRPERIRAATDDDGIPLLLDVTLAEMLGSETIVHGQMGAAKMVARVPSQAGFANGATIAMRADPTDLHVFDVQTGRNLAIGPRLTA